MPPQKNLSILRFFGKYFYLKNSTSLKDMLAQSEKTLPKEPLNNFGVQLGFTLIELMIVCVIIVIISSIGYGSYQHHIIKIHRLEAQTALLEMAAEMEIQRAVLSASEYTQLKVTDVYPKESTPQGWYMLSISYPTADAYQLSATANPEVEKLDKVCAEISLTQTGEKRGECWRG
ncbi:MAG: prepilin-type N-terminal cleavage/methylation domain-containing protein [Gammaproteobacteria bacterium]|nr:prepilin-type N-terminal cleavage/methylation domain-containing protein [Gammaproteobacteria bacterium]